MNDKEDAGLYQKYDVEKGGVPVENCFVLEPENDEAARRAIYEYAKATDNQKLASELRGWMMAVEEVRPMSDDTDAREDDDADDYLGPGPEAWKWLNPEADELFGVDDDE